MVALLVALVGAIGLSIALLDGWLDRRLPHALPGRTQPTAAYASVALTGAVLVLPFVLVVFLASGDDPLPVRAGHALLVVGLCTATAWALRVQGRPNTPPALVMAARGAILVAVLLGVLTSVPHIALALGAVP